MKRIAILAFFAASLTAAAQQPPAHETPAQVEIQKQASALQTKTQLDYSKIRDLQEVQDYLRDLQEMQQLSARYNASAAQAPAKAAVPPPAKPAAPKK